MGNNNPANDMVGALEMELDAANEVIRSMHVLLEQKEKKVKELASVVKSFIELSKIPKQENQNG